MNAPPQPAGPGPLTLSYLGLRRAVGLIGLFLPLVLALGAWLLDGTGLRDSLSGYYYTGMRDVFVGSLCAIGVFLLCYRYDRPDDLLGDIAGALVIGVALLPTAPADPTPEQRVVGVVHLVCAALYFVCLAVFALVLFTRTGDEPPTPAKRRRNVVYRVCGAAIVVALLLAVASGPVLGPELAHRWHALFWLESVAVLAFGVSWLVKGEAILADAADDPTGDGTHPGTD